MDTAAISAIASVISALTAFIVVGYTMVHAPRMARRERTLAFIHEYNSSQQVLLAFRFIRAVASAPLDEQVKQYQSGDNRDNFLFLMNKFENLAIGLQHKIYDHGLIREFFGRDIWVIYDNSQELIRYIRAEEDDKEAFRKFEKLAKQIEQVKSSR